MGTEEDGADARFARNPDYFEDLTPSDFNAIAGIGIELWSMTEDILFDNVRLPLSLPETSS